MTPKRPLGLAKAAKLKKFKKEAFPEPPADELAASLDNSEPAANDTEIPENALNIDLDEAGDAGSDEELAEVYGLFNAFDKAGQDLQKLAYGIVHECDSLLRQREKLPPKFHLIYGVALLTLSRYQDTSPDDPDSSAAFIEAALERLQVGLDQSPEDGALLAAKALAWVEQIEDTLRQTKRKKQLTVVLDAKDRIVEVMELIDQTGVSKDTERRISDAIDALIEFTGSLDSLPMDEDITALQKTIYTWSLDKLAKLLESSDPAVARAANKGHGRYHLFLAAPLLAVIEGEDDDEEEENDNDEDDNDDDQLDSDQAKEARTHLAKAVTYLEKAQIDENPQSLVEVAEALISYGNLFQVDSNDQHDQYKKAVRLLKKAQRLGAGSFHELIESLE